MPTGKVDEIFDLLVVGGGVNGCGIARDAAGRGLSVLLCEMGDLAQATSSASTKLFHGGLRYLEHFEFRLVREALIEREVLWRNMPHISWPMRFVLPHHSGLRPFWLIWLGLFLYDHLGGRRRTLPGTAILDLRRDAAGRDLSPVYRRGFEYSDCWVDDARLVVLNARDAADRGADIRTRTRLERAWREDGVWRAELRDLGAGGMSTVRARAIVNAAGPWAAEVCANRLPATVGDPPTLRLVRGSHIVARRLFEHDRCYVLQNADGRIVFAIPYERDFTLIGTTDRDHSGEISDAHCTAEERDYLLSVVAGYFRKPLDASAIVHSFAGVRPLFDPGEGAASAASRDYTLTLDADAAAPTLTVLGGKITTYRRLAEAAMRRLRRRFPEMGPDWTGHAPLPGGDGPVDGKPAGVAALRAAYGFLSPDWADRLWRTYGTLAAQVLGDADCAADLGEDFGGGLTAREAEWLVSREWARTAEDILWRRTKIGLHLGDRQVDRLAQWLQTRA